MFHFKYAVTKMQFVIHVLALIDGFGTKNIDMRVVEPRLMRYWPSSLNRSREYSFAGN